MTWHGIFVEDRIKPEIPSGLSSTAVMYDRALRTSAASHPEYAPHRSVAMSARAKSRRPLRGAGALAEARLSVCTRSTSAPATGTPTPAERGSAGPRPAARSGPGPPRGRHPRPGTVRKLSPRRYAASTDGLNIWEAFVASLLNHAPVVERRSRYGRQAGAVPGAARGRALEAPGVIDLRLTGRAGPSCATASAATPACATTPGAATGSNCGCALRRT